MYDADIDAGLLECFTVLKYARDAFAAFLSKPCVYEKRCCRLFGAQLLDDVVLQKLDVRLHTLTHGSALIMDDRRAQLRYVWLCRLVCYFTLYIRVREEAGTQEYYKASRCTSERPSGKAGFLMRGRAV